MSKILVAMSGGVDSSVAALLLRDQGHHVVGVTMCLGIRTPDGAGSRCCGTEAIDDARRVCDRLGIPHYVFDFAALFQQHVVDDFFAEYRDGRTPNPCVRCNQLLKFGLLLDKARSMGFDRLATGHYARIGERQGHAVLSRAADNCKDQTYFLYCIKRADLSSIVFPLADMVKDQTRVCARDAGLPVAEKAESQDICFVNEGTYRDLMGASSPGEIVDTSGTVLGTHKGIVNYTIGQRKGLGIAAGRPLYVVALDTARNRVVVGEESDLSAHGMAVGQLNLLVDELPSRVTVKIRYAHAPASCRVRRDSDVLTITFDEPQKAVTPGQSAVLYDGDVVLGGGIIQTAVKA